MRYDWYQLKRESRSLIEATEQLVSKETSTL